MAHGLVGALYDELAYDGDGRMLTASLMDYLLPTACEVPALDIAHLESPSPSTPARRKSMGDGGTIGAHAAVANAVANALAQFCARVKELPLIPERVRRLLPVAERRTAFTPP